MAFIHEGSCECAKSELDLFSVPPTQTSIETGSFVECRSIASLDNNAAPIEFDVSSSGEDYMDLANSYLHIKVKIVKENGNDLAVTDGVGPVNNLLHSLFSQVDVSLNGTSITKSSDSYPYRAYLENLLSFGPAAKKYQLTAAVFYKDEPGKMDKPNPLAGDGERNSGHARRALFTAESKEVDLVGRLHSDIFFQSRYMLNEVTVKIKLTRSKDSFCLMSDAGAAFKVYITGAAMVIRKVKISPSVYIAHAKTMEQGTAKYPIRRVICKSFTIPSGFVNVTQEKLFSGQLPTRIVLACVDNKAFNGDFARNPFNFQHFGLSGISVYLDGQQTGIKPLELNYSRGQYVTSFMSLFSGTGKENQDEGNDLDRTDFAKGYAVYVFDLTPDLVESESFTLIKSGSVRVDMSFDTATSNTITVLAYAEFENIIEIDRNRNVVFDV